MLHSKSQNSRMPRHIPQVVLVPALRVAKSIKPLHHLDNRIKSIFSYREVDLNTQTSSYSCLLKMPDRLHGCFMLLSKSHVIPSSCNSPHHMDLSKSTTASKWTGPRDWAYTHDRRKAWLGLELIDLLAEKELLGYWFGLGITCWVKCLVPYLICTPRIQLLSRWLDTYLSFEKKFPQMKWVLKNNIIKKIICKLIQNNNYAKIETFMTWKYNKRKMIFINNTCKIIIKKYHFKPYI